LKLNPFYKENKKQLFSLIKSIYNTETNEDFWNWRIFNEKFGQAIQYGMWDDEILVGYHVLHPIPMKIKNNVEKILFSMATMTHPDYRGQGIFQKLTKTSYEKATNLGYKSIIGFPNKNSQKTFFEKLNWINLGTINEYYTETFDLQFKNFTNFKISRLEIFDNRINEIWNSNKHNHDFIIERSMNYLNWRFIETPKIKFQNQPISEYFCFLLERENPETYFVIKKYGTENAHIVDIFGKLNKENILEILKYSFEFCKREKISYLSFWPDSNSNNQHLFSILDECKFQKKSSETFRGICILDNKIKKLIGEKPNWFYTMSDSDTY